MHYVLELRKKDLFVIMKGYMCNYDFIQGPFCSCVEQVEQNSFSGGCFCKMRCIYCMAAIFAFESRVEVNLL